VPVAAPPTTTRSRRLFAVAATLLAGLLAPLAVAPAAGAAPAPFGGLHGAALLAARAGTVSPSVRPAAAGQAPTEHAAAASSDRTPGYWLVASDGGVYAFGLGSLGQVRPQPLNRPVVATVATPDGSGYWLVASDGGVFSFGDARFYGSTGAVRLNEPIVGMAATPDGRGYWLVASDGGIFTFGDAGFYGSTGAVRLNEPIVGMAATPDGRGYWLVASDGGIFTFGDAAFHGSTGAVHLVRPIVGMAATPDGRGYWLVASDGGIFSFGDATFDGSTGGDTLAEPIVAMAAAPAGGYWLVASDGGIFPFGGAPYLGSTGADPGPAPIVAIASTANGAAYVAGTIGSDYSFPQCPQNSSGGYPPSSDQVAVVGVNGGLSDTDNPCFAAEAANAGTYLTVYLNTDGDQPSAPQAMSGPDGNCQSGDLICTGYNWGYNNAAASIAYVHQQGFYPTLWWLDVERPCGYSGSGSPLWMCGSSGQASNAAVIQGAIDAVHAAGSTAGIYSTYLQWPATTGGSAGDDAINYPGMPIWIAWDPADSSQADESTWSSICTNASFSFAGGSPLLVQWGPGSGAYPPPTAPYDADYACPEP
jgi:hypothetical protein